MEVAREDISLLEALREDLSVRSVKDGCSPQGQCGCCTVLVDGAARVSCVTPLRRVAGRSVSTVATLPDAARLVTSFAAHGASQCGFCTPGILCRLAALPASASDAQVESALLAHLCRCTGWRSIVSASGSAKQIGGGSLAALEGPGAGGRAALEGRVAQSVGPDVVLGRGRFADDEAPAGALVAVPIAGADPVSLSGWSVAPTLAAARVGAGKVQGRRSGSDLAHPVAVPDGEWDITLQTTWVEPAYLEPDASWCEPGGTPASPYGNGGAFGGKLDSHAPTAARMLADHYGAPVRVLYSREDVVRLGPKRPPAGAGVRLGGSGVLRLGWSGPRLPGELSDSVGFLPVSGRNPTESAAPSAGDSPRFPVYNPGNRGELILDVVPVSGPPTSSAIRAAGWAEAAVLQAAAAATSAGARTAIITTTDGARAEAVVTVDPTGWPVGVEVEVDAGDPLDEVVLRSYVQGAAHMAIGWVCSEGIAVDEEGVPTDLTIRSFGILRAKDTPPISVTVVPGAGRPAVAVADAAFAAVAAATWLAQGLPSRWPTMRGSRR